MYGSLIFQTAFGEIIFHDLMPSVLNFHSN